MDAGETMKEIGTAIDGTLYLAPLVWVWVCVSVCVCACARACVCVHARACVCVVAVSIWLTFGR